MDDENKSVRCDLCNEHIYQSESINCEYGSICKECYEEFIVKGIDANDEIPF